MKHEHDMLVAVLSYFLCLWVIGFTKGLGLNVQFFKVQNGEYGGADEPKILSDLPNELLNDVQTSQQMFPHPPFVRN